MSGNVFRDFLRTVGAPEDPVATDTTSAWSLISLWKAIYANSANLLTAAGVVTLTNKTIDAALNTISNLNLAMFATNVADTDGALTANSDARVATQKATKTYADTKVPLAYLDADGTLAANSDTKVATQKAGKTYADTKVPLSYLDTDGTLAANSDSKVATQKAVKSYADALIAANDAMVFKGVVDCSSNPNYPAANRGDTYRVSVAGKIGGGSGTNVEIGDLLLCITDGTSSGTQAGVGSSWTIAQTNLDGAVIGPASVSDSTFAHFDGTSGKLIKSITATVATAALNAAVGDGGAGGTKGMVPAPGAGDAAAGKFLKADMTFAVPSGGGSGGSNSIADGRLTLSTGVPVPSADVTAATTLYYTPYVGNKIALYDGVSAWAFFTLTEKSISLSGLTANTNYDCFIYDSSGLTLELVAWTNATTRVTGVAFQDGVLVKSGTTTKRYLGTIRTTSSTGQCEDSKAKRYVWNVSNRRPRNGQIEDTGANHTYQSATIRQWNANAAMKCEFVIGYEQDWLSAVFSAAINSTSFVNGQFGFGLDTTSAFSGGTAYTDGGTNIWFGMTTSYSVLAPLGYHYLSVNESSGPSAVVNIGNPSNGSRGTIHLFS